MVNYKKHYANLCGTISDALTLMENDDLLQWDKIKTMLQNALTEAEDQIIEEMDDKEG